MPMRNMSKTDSGCGASCAATSPETIAAGVGRDGSYVVTDAPRATGRRSMGTIVQQPPGALPVVAVISPDLRRCLLRRWCSRRRRPRPPARSPHASLRLGVVDLEARPCPPFPPPPSTPAAPGRWGVAWRVVSKPGQALPPPTGTAAWPRRLRDGLQSGVRAYPGPAAAFRVGVCGECGRIRIGCRYPDRLLSYPDLRYLSGCLLPIRMCCSLGAVASVRGGHWPC